MQHIRQQLIRLGNTEKVLRPHIVEVLAHLEDDGETLSSIRRVLEEEGEDLSEDELFSKLETAFTLFLAVAPDVHRVSKFKYWYDPDKDVESLRGSDSDREAANRAVDAFLTFSGIIALAEDLLELAAGPYEGMLLQGTISPFQMVNGLSVQFGGVHDFFLSLPRNLAKDEATRSAIEDRLSSFDLAIDKVEELRDGVEEVRDFLDGMA